LKAAALLVAGRVRVVAVPLETLQLETLPLETLPLSTGSACSK
jgi:hypothetical protein